MKKNTILICCIVASLLGCQDKKEIPVKEQTQQITTIPNAKETINFIGTYFGILPCDDCEGMETTITLNENSTYTKTVQYLGKGDKLFQQKGTFSWNEDGSIVQLDNIQSGPNQYVVRKNALVQIGKEGKGIKGILSKNNTLIKQSAAAAGSEAAPVIEKTINLNNKLESTTEVMQVDPAEGKYSLAETKWKLTTLNGKKITQHGKKSYYIKMNSADGRFSAYAGCNSIMGNYAMPKSNSIAFFEIGVTQVECRDMTVEIQFVQMLEESAKYNLNKETLLFFGAGKKPIATFVATK
jgi:copper homeostasis protein (lipoprotein)